MTPQGSKRLKAGDRVIYSDGVKGTVTEVGSLGVSIAWEDGQRGVIYYGDMEDVARDVVPRIA